MEYKIAKGIIKRIDKRAKSKDQPIGLEDLGLIMREIFTKYRIPYNDPNCPDTDHISTIRWNDTLDKLEKLSDPYNHIYTPLNLVNDYQVRFNPFQRKLDYFDPTTGTYINIGVITGPGPGTPSDGIQFEDGSVLVLNDNTILTF